MSRRADMPVAAVGAALRWRGKQGGRDQAPAKGGLNTNALNSLWAEFRPSSRVKREVKVVNVRQQRVAASASKRIAMKASGLRAVAVLFFMTACATPIDYSPDSRMPVDQAKRNIRRAIEEGYSPARPKHVEITNEKIRMEFDRNVRLEGARGRSKDVFYYDGITTVSDTQTVYFKTLEKLRLVRSGTYFVQALDGGDGRRLSISCASEEFAKELMDSLATMMRFARNADSLR